MKSLGRSARRGERGATLVEAALLMPLLVLLVFGIIEFGLIFKDSLAVSSATRAGARTASALPRTVGFADQAASAVAKALSVLPANAPVEMWVYKADVNGNPDSGNFTSCTVCWKYTSWNSVTRQWNAATYSFWNATGAGASPPSENACSPPIVPPATVPPNGPPDSIGIYLKATHKMITGLFGSTKTLTDHTVFRLEPVPTGQTCSGA